MSKIETYKDLVQEKAKLEAALILQKSLIKKDWLELKEELNPISKGVDHVKKMFSRDPNNPLVDMGINIASDVVLKKFILARTGWLTRLVVPYLIKNYSSHFIKDSLQPKTNGVGLTNKSNGHQLVRSHTTHPYEINFLHRLGNKLKSNN